MEKYEKWTCATCIRFTSQTMSASEESHFIAMNIEY